MATSLFPVNAAYAENTYGPVKVGTTLWEIAQKTRTDNSISIEQIAYAIYQTNPDAFNSGNMNLLQKGAVLTIPDNQTILETSSSAAKKQLSQHLHALDLLRADARQLSKAKVKSRLHKQRIKTLQKKLAEYRYESDDWNNMYLKLVSAKRKYAASKREVVKLRGLLLEKTTLKLTDSLGKSQPSDNNNEVNQQLTRIQSSLENLNASNGKLLQKVEQLETLTQRIKVLEDELGKNDELVIQLKDTLQSVQQMVQQQKLESEKFRRRFDALDTQNTVKQQDSAQLQNSAQQQDSTQQQKKPDEVMVAVENTSDLNRSGVAPIVSNKSLENGESLVKSNGSEIRPERANQNANHKTSENPDQSSSESSDTVSQNPDQEFLKKASFKPAEVASDSLENEQDEFMGSKMLFSASNTLLDTEPHFPDNQVSVNKVMDHQRISKEPRQNYTSSSYWIDLIKDKIILIGGLLNGLILLFVIYKLTVNNQGSLEVEGDNSKSSGT